MTEKPENNEKRKTTNNDMREDYATSSPYGTKVSVNNRAFFTCQQCGIKLPSYTAYQVHFENCEKQYVQTVSSISTFP